MESFFNYVWALAAIASVCLWLRLGLRRFADRRQSFTGLFLFIVILFPVISISDDLWSLQNPAETKTFQLRDECETGSHAGLAAITALPEPTVAELSFGLHRIELSLPTPLLAVDNPALEPLQNRPPPSA